MIQKYLDWRKMNVLHSKKILFITPQYFSFVKDQVDTLAPHFKEINVLVRYNPFAELARYLPINSWKIKRQEYLINLKNTPDNVHIYPIPVYYIPLFPTAFERLGEMLFREIDKTIAQNNIQFDIIHSHFVYPEGFAGAKIKSKYQKPLVLTAHGYDIYDLPFKNPCWTNAIRNILNQSDLIITVSKSNMKYINQIHTSSKATIIPNGFRQDLFSQKDMQECRNKLKIPLDKKIILTVGNLEPVKGHIFFIDAIEILIQTNHNILCIIIGCGKLYRFLHQQIYKKKLQKFIWLVGSKQHDEIPFWINAADIFVLPSIKEGFGVAQIEALACGKPLVATRNGGSEPLIISDEIGFLVNKGDSHDLAQNLEKALNKSWNSTIIKNSVDQYRWNIIKKQICEAYEALFSKT